MAQLEDSDVDLKQSFKEILYTTSFSKALAGRIDNELEDAIHLVVTVTSTMPKLDRLLSLNCFILDERDDPNDIFQVVIESTKTVQNLKEAILTQRRFRVMPVDVRDLRLWSKIIPVDSNIQTSR